MYKNCRQGTEERRPAGVIFVAIVIILVAIILVY